METAIGLIAMYICGFTVGWFRRGFAEAQKKKEIS